MGKSATDATVTQRYPDYVEDIHQVFLGDVAALVDTIKDTSPYDSYEPIADDIETAYFGVGYVITDFPSLYDMYGKFMAGLDVEVLFDQIFEESTQGAVINNLASVMASRLSDDLEQEAIPRFETGLRDINSVMSSSFMVGKAMIEAQRVKEVAKFDAELRYKMIPYAVERWRNHLLWNRDMIKMYLDMIDKWVQTKMDIDNQDMTISAKDTLWPLDTYKYLGEALGALTGAGIKTQQTPLGKHILGGVLSGAAAGLELSGGNPYGAVIGGVIGGLLGLAETF